MLDKCEEGTRYIHRNQFESAIVPNAFSVASARRDECESRESRPGNEINVTRPTEMIGEFMALTSPEIMLTEAQELLKAKSFI